MHGGLSARRRNGSPDPQLGKMRAGLDPGDFTSPHGIAVDRLGDIFVGELSGRSWGRFARGPAPKRLRFLNQLEKAAV